MTDMTDLTTEIARATEEIAAPPEDVFDALLDPEALAQWFIAPDEGSTRDWEVEPVAGGAWRARTVAPDGTEGELRGDVITVDAPRVLELRWHRAANDDCSSTVRFDLEPIWRTGERATRLTITHIADNPLATRVMMGSASTACLDVRLVELRLAALAHLPALLLRSLVLHLASAPLAPR